MIVFLNLSILSTSKSKLKFFNLAPNFSEILISAIDFEIIDHKPSFLFLYIFPRFTLIKEHLVEFNQLAMANAEGSDHMLNRVMPKDNIGLAALLRTTEAAWDNGEY